MPKREIRKTTITYEEDKLKEPSPDRSREKVKVEVIDQSSRKARLAALKQKQVEAINSNP